jgi:hypothetical protein
VSKYRKLILFIIVVILLNNSAESLVLANSTYALKKGDWMEYDDYYTDSYKAGKPSDFNYPLSYKHEITSVQGNTFTCEWTSKMTDGSSDSGIWTFTSEAPMLLVALPADTNIGDRFFENEMIINGEIQREYAGKARTVIFYEGPFFSEEVNVTYYYDKQTGIFLESKMDSGGLILRDTNVWGNEQKGIPGFPTLAIALGLVAVLFLARAAGSRREGFGLGVKFYPHTHTRATGLPLKAENVV